MNETLVKAAKEIQNLCAHYGNDCFKEVEGEKHLCPFYSPEYGCILKEYPEKWRLS